MEFLSYLISGISLGSVYAIIALGYTMVYGISKMLNFAHGDVIMVGAYVSFCATSYLGLPGWASVILSCAVCTVLGVLIEGLAYKPLRQAGPLAVLIIAIIAAECGKMVSKETKVDILVTPGVTILIGVALAKLIAPPIGTVASAFGLVIDNATKLQPFWMGIAVSVLVGIALTLPISSAAICSVLGLTGLAGGAAVAGCCAQMVGFAVMSFKENRWGGLVSQGLGTSMLQMGNIVRNPRIWIPPTLASAITGPIATCVFGLEMNGAPINSGMGTCGLCGQIGVWTGWLAPSEEALARGAAAIVPTSFDWLGMILICFVLPAVLSWAFCQILRKIGWIREGDLTLPQ